jgi:hypothetical protein
MVDTKKALLNIGEETVKQVYLQVIKPMAEEMIVKSENKIDDIVLPFLGQLDAAVLGLVDRIDGEAG